MLELLELVTLINQCAPNVHPQTMLAVVQKESRGEQFAVNVNTKGVAQPKRPETLQEAIALVQRLRKQGVNFDAGLAQINSGNFERLGLTPENVFDPCTNIAAGGRVLTENYTRAAKAPVDASPAAQPEMSQDTLNAALSAYNTGNFSRGIRNGYVSKVRASSRKYAVPALADKPNEDMPNTEASALVQMKTPQEKPSWDVFARPVGVLVFEK